MNEKIADLLTQLAAKLGTTAENLWTILVHGQRALGVMDLFVGGVLLLIAVACVKGFQNAWKSDTDSWKTDYTPIYLLTVFGGIGCLVFAVAFLYDAGLELMSPEFAALRYILAMLGGRR